MQTFTLQHTYLGPVPAPAVIMLMLDLMMFLSSSNLFSNSICRNLRTVLIYSRLIVSYDLEQILLQFVYGLFLNPFWRSQMLVMFSDSECVSMHTPVCNGCNKTYQPILVVFVILLFLTSWYSIKWRFVYSSSLWSYWKPFNVSLQVFCPDVRDHQKCVLVWFYMHWNNFVYRQS